MSEPLIEAIGLLNGTLSRVEALLGTLIEQQAARPATTWTVAPAAAEAGPVDIPGQQVIVFDAPSEEAEEAAAAVAAAMKPTRVKRSKKSDPRALPKTVEAPPHTPAPVAEEASEPAPAPAEEAPPAPEPYDPGITLPQLRQLIRDQLVTGAGWSASDVREWLAKDFGFTKTEDIIDPVDLGRVRDAVLKQAEEEHNR